MTVAWYNTLWLLTLACLPAGLHLHVLCHHYTTATIYTLARTVHTNTQDVMLYTTHSYYIHYDTLQFTPYT
jgi:hypothetical protein